jgi:predicted DCC family thiol-disulfide oxidoreductase YuxK
MQKSVLIYDGDCGFCRKWMRWFKAHDAAGHMEYLARQAPEREARYPQLNDAKYQGALQLILPSGEIHSGEMATSTALQYISGIHWHLLGKFITLPGIRFFAHIGYKIIAKNRHRFACKDGSCKI